MTALRCWIVAASFGNAENGVLGIAKWLAPNSEIATAAVAAKLVQESGTKLALASVAVLELKKEDMQAAIAQIDAAETVAAPEKVVQLVATPPPL